MEHTPGPWIAQRITSYTFGIYSEVASTWNGVKYADDPIALYVKHESNAALIAAAPELLYACSILCRYVMLKERDGADTPSEVLMGRVAIAKAKGEQDALDSTTSG